MNHPRYIVNEKGERIQVVLDIKDYEKILEALEDLDDVRAYDQAKAEGDEFISLEELEKQIGASGE